VSPPGFAALDVLIIAVPRGDRRLHLCVRARGGQPRGTAADRALCFLASSMICVRPFEAPRDRHPAELLSRVDVPRRGHHVAVHLVVACAPVPWDGSARLDHAPIIKTAMLYGDEITVLTPAAFTPALPAELEDADDVVVLRAARRLLAPGALLALGQDSPGLLALMVETALDGLPPWLASARDRGGHPPPDARDEHELRRMLAAHFRGVAARMRELHWARTGIDGLHDAQRAGWLRVEQPTDVPSDPADSLLSFFGRLRATLNDGGRYAVLDTGVADMVHRGVAGLLDQDIVAATPEPGAASLVLGLLPGLPHATLEEIAIIRERLADPLITFRSLVIEGSDGLPPAHDPQFGRAVDQWWRRDVEPQLLALRRELAAASSWKRVSASFLDDNRGLVAAGALAATALHPAIPGASLTHGALTTGAGMALLAARAIRSARRDRAAAEVDGVFFLHHAAEMLAAVPAATSATRAPAEVT
jgi:hypothetical protein